MKGGLLLDSFLTLVFALVMVILVVYLSYRFSRFMATGTGRYSNSKYIKVLDRVQLGQDQALLIARIGDKNYLIGTATNSVQILTELDEGQIGDTTLQEMETGFSAMQAGASFQSMLGSVLTKKKK